MIVTEEMTNQIDDIKNTMLEILLFNEEIGEEARYMMIADLVTNVMSDDYYSGKNIDEASVLAGVIIETMYDHLINNDYDGFIDYVKQKLIEQERYEYLHELQL